MKKALKHNPPFILHDLQRAYYMIIDAQIARERAAKKIKPLTKTQIKAGERLEKVKFNPNKPWKIVFDDHEVSSNPGGEKLR